MPGRGSNYPRRAALVAAAAAVICTTVWAADEPRAGDEAAAAPQDLLVSGERPGPGLWRVSKAGHVLWILATLEPLPKEMTWRSRTVDARIAESQTVLSPPSIDLEVGLFRSLTLVPSLLRARKNADGSTLEQVLPHDEYMRWLALRVKYLGRWSGDEHVRPMVAAHDLYTHAIEETGLTDSSKVWDAVKQTARHARIPVQEVTLKLPLEDPKGTIQQLGRISRDAELGCLDTTMARLETDLQAMRQRANLWSLGDVEGLRALPYPDQSAACFDALSSAPGLGERMHTLERQLQDLWLAAVDQAVERNPSSVAVLPITVILPEDGYLASLRQRGYEVTAP
jgi:uncharacterized protein YbaP (TraB family)